MKHRIAILAVFFAPIMASHAGAFELTTRLPGYLALGSQDVVMADPSKELGDLLGQ